MSYSIDDLLDFFLYSTSGFSSPSISIGKRTGSTSEYTSYTVYFHTNLGALLIVGEMLGFFSSTGAGTRGWVIELSVLWLLTGMTTPSSVLVKHPMLFYIVY